MSCKHCESMSFLCDRNCERCGWRNMARGIHAMQDVWWEEQKAKGKDMDAIDAYWQEVWAHDDLKQAASG